MKGNNFFVEWIAEIKLKEQKRMKEQKRLKDGTKAEFKRSAPYAQTL
jgi:hypothetical protein